MTTITHCDFCEYPLSTGLMYAKNLLFLKKRDMYSLRDWLNIFEALKIREHCANCAEAKEKEEAFNERECRITYAFPPDWSRDSDKNDWFTDIRYSHGSFRLRDGIFQQKKLIKKQRCLINGFYVGNEYFSYESEPENALNVALMGHARLLNLLISKPVFVKEKKMGDLKIQKLFFHDQMLLIYERETESKETFHHYQLPLSASSLKDLRIIPPRETPCVHAHPWSEEIKALTGKADSFASPKWDGERVRIFFKTGGYEISGVRDQKRQWVNFSRPISEEALTNVWFSGEKLENEDQIVLFDACVRTNFATRLQILNKLKMLAGDFLENEGFLFQKFEKLLDLPFFREDIYDGTIISGANAIAQFKLKKELTLDFLYKGKKLFCENGICFVKCDLKLKEGVVYEFRLDLDRQERLSLAIKGSRRDKRTGNRIEVVYRVLSLFYEEKKNKLDL